jgi:hypothetical protein
MTDTWFCASSLQYYTLPDWRLEIEGEFFGADVEEVIKMREIPSIERDDAAPIGFQIYGLVFYSSLRDKRLKIAFSPSGHAG